MRNLNKQQIEAITDKILSELNIDMPTKADVKTMNKLFEGKWKEFRKSGDRKILEKYGHTRTSLSDICENETLNGFEYRPSSKHKSIAHIKIKDGSQYIGIYPLNTVDRNAIRNEIILAQLEVSDLNSLIDTVRSTVLTLIDK